MQCPLLMASLHRWNMEIMSCSAILQILRRTRKRTRCSITSLPRTAIYYNGMEDRQSDTKEVYKERGLIMFSEKQITFMKSLGLEVDFNNLTDDDLAQIEEIVSDELQMSGFDISDNITDVGKMCESILDDLAEM